MHAVGGYQPLPICPQCPNTAPARKRCFLGCQRHKGWSLWGWACNSGYESSVVIHDDAACRRRSRRRGPISTGTRLHVEHGAGMGLASSTATPERCGVCGRGIGRPDIGAAIVWHLHWLPRQERPRPNVWRQLRIPAPVGALLLIGMHRVTPWRGARSRVGHVRPRPARRVLRSGSPECQNVPRGAGRVHVIPAPPLANPVPPRARGVASRRYSMFRYPPVWLVINTRQKPIRPHLRTRHPARRVRTF